MLLIFCSIHYQVYLSTNYLICCMHHGIHTYKYLQKHREKTLSLVTLSSVAQYFLALKLDGG